MTRGMFLIILAAAVVSSTLFAVDANDIGNIPLLRWVGPGQPGTFAEYRAEHPAGPLVIQPIGREMDAMKGPMPPNGPKILVIVNNTLRPLIGARLTTYTNDLTAAGYTVETYTCTQGNAEDLKTFIVGKKTSLVGCVFVGSIPSAWFEIANDHGVYGYAVFPCDLFLMDLDGTWTDVNSTSPMQAGVYDDHTAGSGDLAPEIFIGHIDASMVPGTEADNTNAYFDKLHAFYTGSTVIVDYGLTYTEDDWQSDWDFLNNVKSAFPAYSALAGTATTPNTERNDYLNNRLASTAATAYGFIQLACHSASTFHAFSRGGSLDSTTVRASVPQAVAYNLFCCSGARYTDPNFLAGSYVFNVSANALVAIGSTKAGSMLNFSHFYIPLGRRKSFGQAFCDWFQSNTWSRHWFYGMAVIGDPLLTVVPLPEVNFAVSSGSGDESAAAPAVQVTLSRAGIAVATVDYTVTAGSATSGSDYTLAAGTLTFVVNDTSETIPLAIIDDASDEDAEDITISLDGPSAALMGSATDFVYTINDNDDLPSVAFSAAAQSVAESAGTVLVTVSVSVPSGKAITVPCTVAGGSTASDPADYTIAASPLVIPAGADHADVLVTVVDDTDQEADETIVITMGTPTDATQGAVTGHTITILDNDLPSKGKQKSHGCLPGSGAPWGMALTAIGMFFSLRRKPVTVVA
ncbi:MAG: Calx-beta domain-containing protein [Planctomycetota bacterium]